MIAVLFTALIVLGLPTLYFAWRSREFRKFLTGAFFVSAGIQFYLYLAKVSVPLLGTNLVATPDGHALPRRNCMSDVSNSKFCAGFPQRARYSRFTFSQWI
jgi:hypothetical protein